MKVKLCFMLVVFIFFSLFSNGSQAWGEVSASKQRVVKYLETSVYYFDKAKETVIAEDKDLSMGRKDVDAAIKVVNTAIAQINKTYLPRSCRKYQQLTLDALRFIKLRHQTFKERGEKIFREEKFYRYIQEQSKIEEARQKELIRILKAINYKQVKLQEAKQELKKQERLEAQKKKAELKASKK